MNNLITFPFLPLFPRRFTQTSSLCPIHVNSRLNTTNGNATKSQILTREMVCYMMNLFVITQCHADLKCMYLKQHNGCPKKISLSHNKRPLFTDQERETYVWMHPNISIRCHVRRSFRRSVAGLSVSR